MAITRTTVCLRSDYCGIDLADFTQALERAAKTSLPEEQEASLRAAIALYRADLLTDFPDYFTAERARAAHRYEEALRRLAEIQKQRGDAAGAIDALKRLVAYDPLQEEAHAELMRLYAAAGQTALVRQQFQELETALRDNLGDAPAEATQRLFAELRKRSTENSLAAPVAPPSPAPETPPTEAPNPHPLLPPPPDPLPVTPLPPTHSRRPFRFVWGLWAGVVFASLTIALTWQAFRQKPGAALPENAESAAIPPLERGAEKWVFQYKPRPGEKVGAEGRAVGVNGYGRIFVTGLIQTEKEDADILTLCLNEKGEQLWADRYHSPTHDCDRAFSMSLSDSGYFYVAGETYIPRPAKAEGWHLTLIKYSLDGKQLWARQSPTPNSASNIGHKVKVLVSVRDEIYVAGTAAEGVEGAIRKILFLRYTPDGKLLYEQKISEGDDTRTVFCDMAIGKDDEPILCGTTRRGTTANGVNDDWLICCYTREGKRRWRNFWENPGADGVGGIGLSGGLQPYIGGIVQTGDPANGGHGANLALAKFDADGKPLWKRTIPASGPTVAFGALAIDPLNGQPVLAGNQVPTNGDRATFFARYDAEGNQLWQNAPPPPPGFRNVGITSAIPIVTGGIFTIGDISLNARTDRAFDTELYVTFLNPDGSSRWRRAYNGKGNGADGPRAASLFHDAQQSDSLIVAGHTALPNGDQPLMVVRYDF